MCYLVALNETEFPLPSELSHDWVNSHELKELWLAPNIEPFRDELIALLEQR